LAEQAKDISFACFFVGGSFPQLLICDDMIVLSYISNEARMTDKKTKDAVAALKVISNPARFKILRILLRAQEKKQEMCVKEIAEAADISQSAASHQLARLEDRGLVCASRMGQMRCYKICDSPLMGRIGKVIRQFDY